MRGRRHQPTVLKLINGNPGKRPINGFEPKPEVGCDKPVYVSRPAAKVWDELAPALERVGILTEVDASMFATWCELEAERRESPRGISVAKLAQLRIYAGCFGLEPSSRARLSTEGYQPKKKTSDDFFKSTTGI